MGLGDEILATAQARKVYELYGVPVVVGPKAEWSEVFENNPYILRNPVGDYRVLNNYKGNRPYIKAVVDGRMVFSDWKAEPGELYFKFRERLWAERKVGNKPFVVIEPHTKRTVFADNKEWPFERSQKLVDSLPYRFVQLGHRKTLRGVTHIPTESFRQACAVLERATLYVGPEGGLHHAAAALGRPAVVIFGGHSNPNVTGYDFHTNIARGEPCGSMRPCKHCRDAMNSISVAEVAEAVRKVYETRR